MSDVINLRNARKRALRQRQADAASVNRESHAQPKSQRKLDLARRDQASRNLDQHKIGTGDER